LLARRARKAGLETAFERGRVLPNLRIFDCKVVRFRASLACGFYEILELFPRDWLQEFAPNARKNRSCTACLLAGPGCRVRRSISTFGCASRPALRARAAGRRRPGASAPSAGPLPPPAASGPTHLPSVSTAGQPSAASSPAAGGPRSSCGASRRWRIYLGGQRPRPCQRGAASACRAWPPRSWPVTFEPLAATEEE
jgi:hypothetical protein